MASAAESLADFTYHNIVSLKPLLEGAGHAVELSNGKTVDAGAIMRRVLAEYPGDHFHYVFSRILMAGRANGLQVIDGPGLARKPEPVSASFAPAETWERVLAGQAAALDLAQAGFDVCLDWEQDTVPVAMNQAVSSGGRGTDWTLLAAIETLFLIPVFLVTFFGGIFALVLVIVLVTKFTRGAWIALAAMALLTGRKWLDYFMVEKPGRVLIILGEEKLAQAHRRFYELAQSMRLTDAQLGRLHGGKAAENLERVADGALLVEDPNDDVGVGAAAGGAVVDGRNRRLALAVLLDAFLIRLVLLPVLLRLTGRAYRAHRAEHTCEKFVRHRVPHNAPCV